MLGTSRTNGWWPVTIEVPHALIKTGGLILGPLLSGSPTLFRCNKHIYHIRSARRGFSCRDMEEQHCG
jgi:hypothetical protein